MSTTSESGRTTGTTQATAVAAQAASTNAKSERTFLPRLHLFEFLDQAWFPRLLRDGMTGYLETVSSRMGLFDAAKPVLREAIESGASRRVVDLGTGGGGPLPRLQAQLAAEGFAFEALLTDKYPTSEAAARVQATVDASAGANAGAALRYLDRSVDALAVPEDLSGVRTLFNALHHFRPAEVRQILADAQRQHAPFVAFEVVSRSIGGALGCLFLPLLVLLMTPLIRPVSATRLLLTYVVPLLPLLLFWDGLVSTLRAHRPDELLALTPPPSAQDERGYRWEVGRCGGEKGKPVVHFVRGVPVALQARDR